MTNTSTRARAQVSIERTPHPTADAQPDDLPVPDMPEPDMTAQKKPHAAKKRSPLQLLKSIKASVGIAREKRRSRRAAKGYASGELYLSEHDLPVFEDLESCSQEERCQRLKLYMTPPEAAAEGELDSGPTPPEGERT